MKKTINSKNYNKWKKIDIIVVLIICVLSFLFTFLSGTVEEELSFSSIPKDNLIYMIVLVICSIPSLLSLLAFYFGIRYTIKKVEKKNLTYNASKDIMYYREYLDNLTPFEVSILVNLKLEYKKDIIATILWYKNKGYLDIKNEQIIFNNNIDLTEKDKYFFSFLKTKDLKYLDIYKNITYEELKEKKYIIENNMKIVHFFIKNILIIIGFFIFM
ncbi:MAG: hypothetical protein ACI4XR_02740, partial [Bacilli bacterium]